MRRDTLRYGPDPSQFARLYLPEGDPPTDTGYPVAVVIHGGFWRQRYGVDLAAPAAADLADHGVAALAIEYRRIGPGGTGGWPDTLIDVATAVDRLADTGQYFARGRLDLGRVAAVGHSAGGHLAGWLAHRGALAMSDPGAAHAGAVRVRGAVCQAGVMDLAQAYADRLGRDAVMDFLGGTPETVPERYRHASAVAHVGDGARITCVHGDRDDDVPAAQSAAYVAAARRAGDPVTLVMLDGVGHMDHVDPRRPAWAVARRALLEMVGHRPGEAARPRTVR